MTGAKKKINEDFAKIHGSPGLRVRWIGMLRLFWPLLLGIFVAGYLVRCGIPRPPASGFVAGLGLLLLAALLYWNHSHALRRFQAFLKGARGEELVGRELALLPGIFQVFHGVAKGSWHDDLDHVVLGPGGLAVIETKNWKGAVTYRDGEIFINGRSPTRSPIAQARRSAAKLRKILAAKGVNPGEILPVICFVGDAFAADSLAVDGLFLCSSRNLTDVLLSTMRSGETTEDYPAIKIASLLSILCGD